MLKLKVIILHVRMKSYSDRTGILMAPFPEKGNGRKVETIKKLRSRIWDPKSMP